MSAEQIRVSLHELETHWSLKDVFDAHDVLDLFERAAARERQRMREESERQRRTSRRGRR